MEVAALAIPEELIIRPQWVCWRIENRNGKPTKIPYSITGREASSTDPQTWASFEAARRYLEVDPSLDGVGYVFSEDDPFVGVDLDKCIDTETGRIEEWAIDLIDGLDSYTEFSPSGRGFHILIKGKLPPIGRRKGPIEMYESGRYFTVTGQRLPNAPASIMDRSAEIMEIHNRIFGAAKALEREIAERASVEVSLDDAALIEKACRSKNGVDFDALWKGDWGAYGSRSEADLALCNRLAFWAGRDAERVDRLFRLSGLMRKKWDEKRGGGTYGQLTIAKAIEGASEVYQARPKAPKPAPAHPPPQAPTARQALEDRIKATDDFDELTITLAGEVLSANLSKPAEAKLLKDIAKKAGVSVSTLNPQGGDRETGESQTALIAELNSKHAVVPLGGKVLVLNKEYDPALQRELITFSAKADFVLRYCNRRTVKAGQEMDMGTFWLESPQRRQYEGIVFAPGIEVPGYYNLFQGFPIKPAIGNYGRFQELLLDVICGGDDEFFDYLWKWLAHLFQRPMDLPGTAIVLRGKQGTGKNTFVEAVGRLVGKHYIPVNSLQQVTGRFSGHLVDALLVFANEAIWGGDKSAEGTLKAMITDPMATIERKGKDAVTMPNYKRLIVASNEDWVVPRGMDDRRFVILDISDEHKGDADYFVAVKEELGNGGYEALMQALVSVDISDWHPNQIPRRMQMEGWDLKIRSGSSVMQWWFYCLDVGYILPNPPDTPNDRWAGPGHQDEDAAGRWPAEASKQVVYEEYLEWCRRRNINRPVIDSAFGKELRQFGVQSCRTGGRNERRSPKYVFPPIEASRELFSQLAGLPSDYWEEGAT